ncbi:MAG: nitrogenase [Prevotellaceae bacterium]|jgi:nitrogenase molybdenum-iron protein NifN|nr:nitrogenase [Prevotellaceae bacterium]
MTSVNACKQCAPLGACVAFKGIEGALPMLHGSQGCATYIRRYLISHFREPVDVASSSLGEEATIFGGGRNFSVGIDNIISQYRPKVIAIASTCLSETIGEDVQRLIGEYRAAHRGEVGLPEMLFASTPSYQGTHCEGFHEAVCAAVKALANGRGGKAAGRHINLFCSFVSPEDIRHLKEILADWGVSAVVFPDYSDTLDGGSWGAYRRIPEGGTPLEAIRSCACASASVELGYILNAGGRSGRVRRNVAVQSAGEYLQGAFGVACRRTGLPVGVGETDKLLRLLAQLSGKPVPEKYRRQRSRLLDLYADGHKYVSMKKAVIYGEEDLAVALVAFAVEVGIKPVLCATGGESGKLQETLRETLGETYPEEMAVGQGMTFEQMEATLQAAGVRPDLLIGNSKGYYIARRLDVPIVRVGFPIHDRIGAQRCRLLGYEGTTILFEQAVNALLDDRQRKSPVGYKYM